MCLSIQSARADSIYTFMQFDCDESNNTLEIKELHAADYPEFKSLDGESGVLKDLGIEYIQTEHGTKVKDGQLPKTVGRCSLSNTKNETIDVSFSLKEIHLARVRGLCGAASGPVYEVLFNDTIVARFPSGKDQCYPKYNPLNIARLEYIRGRAGLCRVSDNLRSDTEKLRVSWEGELCFYGSPEKFINNRKERKGFEQELFENIALDDADNELPHYGRARGSSVDPAQARHKDQQEKIIQLEKELEETKSELTTEQSKTFWQRLFD